MMRLTSALLLALFVACATASLRHVVEPNMRLSLPEGWERVADAPSSQMLELSIAMHITNKADLEARFWAVSDPKSASYAQYLTLEEIRAQYAPTPKAINHVLTWLKLHNASDISVVKSGDWIRFSMPVSEASSALNVAFAHFKHPRSKKMVTRALDRAYSIPAHLRDIVAFVSPLNRFPVFKGSISGLGLRRQFGASVTPKVIFDTFRTNGTKGSASSNLQGTAQFLEQYYDPADLAAFLRKYDLPDQKVAKVIGPNDPKNSGTEASLDIEYMIGTAPLVPTYFYSTPGRHEKQEPFVAWAQAMNNDSLVPYVVSVSYGEGEETITFDYAQRLDVEFQKLALRGVSVLYASGDNGVGCTRSNCVNLPNWPASSPYVTSVGGFVYQGRGSTPIGDTISSGGFSNFYPRPSYQDAAVKAYFSAGVRYPPASQFNASGRGTPDVSAYSENVAVYQGGIQPVGGTSCASPIFAGIISLVNDAMLNAGKKPLGFLNPALYGIGASSPSSFIDVVKGNNAEGCCRGFNAAKGWDPITGWGGPDFPNLLAAFQSLQN